MKKFLSSKFFVIICTVVSMAIGGTVGVLMGFQPQVSGYSTSFGGSTYTSYDFRIETACGFWLLALMISFLVMLVCILIRKLYIPKDDKQ